MLLLFCKGVSGRSTDLHRQTQTTSDHTGTRALCSYVNLAAVSAVSQSPLTGVTHTYALSHWPVTIHD